MPDPTRRSFLLGIAAGAAALPHSASQAGRRADSGRRRVPSARSAPAAPDDEYYWEQVRARFSFREERVPMNAANLCPSPRAVAARVEELTRDIDRDCSFNNRAKFGALLEESRAQAAAQLGVDPDEVALVRNTSEANNTVAAGIPLSPGEEVVLWDQNHPTNNVAWDVRAARFGFSVRRVSVPARPSGPGELAAPFLAALSDRTRVLSVTHVSNVSGVRLPVRELAAETRRRGIHFHVDGAQTWGALDVSLRKTGCDSYSGPPPWRRGGAPTSSRTLPAPESSSPWASATTPAWPPSEPPPASIRPSRRRRSPPGLPTWLLRSRKD